MMQTLVSRLVKSSCSPVALVDAMNDFGPLLNAVSWIGPKVIV